MAKPFGRRLIIFIFLTVACVVPAFPCSADNSCENTKSPMLLKMDEWSCTEKYAWKMIAAGKPADLGRIDLPCHDGQAIDQSLRSSFLSTILFDDNCKKIIPHFGIRIRSAFFREPLNLENAELTIPLTLEHSHFEKELNFNGLKSNHGISFADSIFSGPLLFKGAVINGHLNMDHSRFQNLEAECLKVNGPLTISGAAINTIDQDRWAIDLMAAVIGGQIILDGARVSGDIHMPGIHVVSQLSAEKCTIKGKIFMPGSVVDHRLTFKDSEISEIQLQGSRIGSLLALSETTVSGIVKLDSILVDGDIFMADGKFNELSLITADIKGRVDMARSKFSGIVKAYGVSVGDTLNLNEAQFTEELRMHRSQIGSILYIKSGRFFDKVSLKAASIKGDLYTDLSEFRKNFDMSGIRINGELIIKEGNFEGDVLINLARIGSFNFKGVKKMVNLDLTGADVDKMMVTVRDARDFPENLKLHGFTYNLFLGRYEGGQGQEKEFFQAWLKKLAEYTPQPYTQCAKVLREFGMPEKANEVLFAGKEEERRISWATKDYGRWLWLSALKWTIGYGIGMKYFQSLIWVVLLIIIGTLVCLRLKDTDELKKLGYTSNKGAWVCCFFYSMDNLLPIIRLRDLHEKIDLVEGARLYFYFHKIAGWLLASFILAGLAGITQK